MRITLNNGQQASVASFNDFMANPNEQLMLIDGPAGVGKTTVVKYIVESAFNKWKTLQLLNLNQPKPVFYFTATTNKAAEQLETAMGGAGEVVVKTIHSLLKLAMGEDENHREVLIDNAPGFMIKKGVIVIDEASMVDDSLLAFILAKIAPEVKVLFMGDEAQLKNASSSEIPPVFKMNIRRASLTEVMRQTGDNPIQALGLKLREAIIKGLPMPACNIDGKYIHWLPRDKFNALMEKDMSSSDWTYSTSKFLAFRNKRVMEYNKRIYSIKQGSAVFQPGDYALNNHFIRGPKGKNSIGTDRLAYIDKVEEGTDPVTEDPGYHVYLNGVEDPYFLPRDVSIKDRRITSVLRKIDKIEDRTSLQSGYDNLVRQLNYLRDVWVDLRPVFGQTIFKSQGSTYRRVYIDLGDLSMCYDKDQRMRMLYVACSRARMQLFLTGDIV